MLGFPPIELDMACHLQPGHLELLRMATAKHASRFRHRSPQFHAIVKSVTLPRNIERSEEYVVFADAFKQV